MDYKGLLAELKDEAIESLDWFNGREITTREITAYLITCELKKHYTGDDITEDEAQEVIQKTRQLVIPQVSHFIDDFAVHQMTWRHQ